MEAQDALAVLEVTSQLYRQHRFAEAQEQLALALIEFPDHGRLLELQGMVWHGLARYESAREALETASLIVALSLGAQLVLADAYRRCDMKQDANTILTYLATRRTLPTPLLANLTASLGAVGNYQLALDVCREALRRQPEADEALFGMGFYMQKLNYPIECVLPVLRRAVELAPDCKTYIKALASTLYQGQHWEEAYEWFSLLNPGDIRCRGCLYKMIYVFDHCGDHVRRDECLCQVMRLATVCDEPESMNTPLPETWDDTE